MAGRRSLGRLLLLSLASFILVSARSNRQSSNDGRGFVGAEKGHVQLQTYGSNSVNSVEYAMPLGETATQISVGHFHSGVGTVRGKVFMIGRNDFGQLGLGGYNDGSTVQTVTEVKTIPATEAVSQIVVGEFHTAVLSASGKVFVAGYNGNGALGLGHTYHQNSFVEVTSIPAGEKPTKVAAGYSHTVVLCASGKLYATGGNGNGQLGVGDRAQRTSFTRVVGVPPRENVIHISAGGYHTVALSSRNKVFGTGHNGHGQLGLGHTKTQLTFVEADTLPVDSSVTQVSAGWYHTILLSNSKVYGAGLNHDEQLGSDRNPLEASYVLMASLPAGERATQVAAGFCNTVILSASGKVFAAGNNVAQRSLSGFPGLMGSGDMWLNEFQDLTN